MTLLPYSALTDEELLKSAYLTREDASPLATELAVRLEHALDELARMPPDTETIIAARSQRATGGY